MGGKRNTNRNNERLAGLKGRRARPREDAAISLTSVADSPPSPCPAGLAMACRPRRDASSRHNRQTRMQKQKGHSAAQRAALENAIESGSGKTGFESFG